LRSRSSFSARSCTRESFDRCDARRWRETRVAGGSSRRFRARGERRRATAFASAFIDDDVARVVTTRSRDDEGTRETRGPAREGENARGDDERRERFVSSGRIDRLDLNRHRIETRHDGRDAHARVHADVRDDERITVHVVFADVVGDERS